MEILDFDRSHIEKAMEIALKNYEEEQKQVPALPKRVQVPDLTHFTENGLGVAAMEGARMIGFLCAYLPREDVFGTTNVRGTFSPIHAHGVITSDELMQAGVKMNYGRERIYSFLYQAAAEKWAKAGIRSHAFAFYTHDKEAINSFFCNGFGLRCIDAILSLKDIPEFKDTSKEVATTLQYAEMPKEEWKRLLDCHNGLIAHLGQSPTFMCFDPIDEAELYRRTTEDTRYFAAQVNGECAAYIKIADQGENYITEVEGMMNICGAYCNPVYRGSKVYHNLLCYLMETLKKEGYSYLGVDYESINPNARGFWPKYFTEYTHSVVRRIDEKAVDVRIRDN